MPPMPYNLEKGPYLSMLEHLFNESPERMRKCLDYLRDPDHLVTGLLHELPAAIPAGPFSDTRQLAAHINEDWFGLRRAPGRPMGFDNEQEPWEPVGHPTTGFWHYWYGDAQGIVRSAFVRAFEMALGLVHGETKAEVDLDGRRHWRINLFTVCGIRWFEAWLNWRQIGDGPADGVVTVLLLTPSHGKPSETTPLRHLPEDRSGWAPYAVDPTRADGDQGLWVVGAEREEHKNPPPVAEQGWSVLGDIRPPRLGPSYVGSGAVVVVATPEFQGGVLPNGRQYEEHRHE